MNIVVILAPFIGYFTPEYASISPLKGYVFTCQRSIVKTHEYRHMFGWFYRVYRPKYARITKAKGYAFIKQRNSVKTHEYCPNYGLV